MKLRYLFLILVASCILAPLAAQCNGLITLNGDKYVLHVWGTHYERGYAHGYLLAERVMQLFTDYFFPGVALNSVTRYNGMLSYYDTYFETDPRFLAEAEAMVAGMAASGISLYHNPLQRNLGLADILVVNAIVDLSYVSGYGNLDLGCASLTSYAEATLDDPQLEGRLVITRFMDWTRHSTLINNPLLVIHHPSETDEVKWMSFTYPGLLGALSAINQYGHGSFLNMGNYHNQSTTYGLDSVLLSIRKGIERMDFNNDTLYDGTDSWAAISGDQHISGTIIHNVWEVVPEAMAQVIETNNSGTMRRFYNENGNLNGRNIAATNHFRVLYPAVPCYRYDRIQDSLAVNSSMSANRQWTLLSGAAGLSHNLMAIQYIPSSAMVKWSVATAQGPAYPQTPWEFDADDLFSQNVGSADEHAPAPCFRLSVWPNPCMRTGSLQIKASNPLSQLRLYNLRGQLMDSFSVAGKSEISGIAPSGSGIYLLRATDCKGQTVSRRIVVY